MENVTGLTPLLDRSDPAHAHVAGRLDAEPVVWFSTVDSGGRPHSVPVWFLFHDPDVLVFSRPDTAKVGRIRARPGVCLALDTAGGGADVVLADGDAARTGEPDAPELAAFAAKYAPMLGPDGIDGWRQVFAAPLRVRLHRIVAWRPGPDGLSRVVAGRGDRGD